MSKIKITTLFVLLLGLRSYAQDLKKYDIGSFVNRNDSISYRILFPENFDPERKYPVLFFLHGRGESGNDNQKQLTHGAKMFLTESFRNKYPAIVLFPQCASDSYWANVNIITENGKRTFNFKKGGKPTKAMQTLVAMVEHFLNKPFIDKSKVYVGGLSMGGMGTYELLRRKRNTFAAAFAICGGDHVANIQRYKKVPLWIFHGEKDDVVPVVNSLLIANQLKVLNYPPKLTLYPKANHNSWDAAFAEPQLLSWLFSNQKQ